MTDDIVVVTSHYDEDLAWLCNCPYKVHLCDKFGAAPVDQRIKNCFICEPMILNLGCEASSYLHYIIRHYGNLPPYVAFIHGHEHAWHQQHPFGLMGAIRTAKKDKFDYVSLNVKTHPGEGRVYDLDDPRCDVPAINILKETWNIVFKPYIGTDLPRQFCHDSCAQFLVSRNAILRHPLEAYKEWYEYVNTPTSDKYDNRDYALAMEYIWHIIFGEPPVCKERDLDYLLSRFNVQLNRSA